MKEETVMVSCEAETEKGRGSKGVRGRDGE